MECLQGFPGFACRLDARDSRPKVRRGVAPANAGVGFQYHYCLMGLSLFDVQPQFCAARAIDYWLSQLGA